MEIEAMKIFAYDTYGCGDGSEHYINGPVSPVSADGWGDGGDDGNGWGDGCNGDGEGDGIGYGDGYSDGLR